MIRLAGQAISLVAAMVLTLGATMALARNGKIFDQPGPFELHAPPFVLANAHIECLCFQPPRRLPRFVHPRAVRMRAPQILCEVPEDPMAVTDCGTSGTERSHRR